MSQRAFDVIVIGAGPAGEVAAGRARRGGLEVALVERQLVGGECSFYACMPSKALLRPAEVLAEARRVPGAAEAVTGSLDVPAALRPPRRGHPRPRRLRRSCRGSRTAASTLVRGAARVDRRAHGRASATRSSSRAARSSSRPAARALIPPIDGPARGRSRGPTARSRRPSTCPARLLILGGGVVGVEMAQAFASLGAEVTLVEARRPRSSHARSRSPPSRSQDALRERGVRIVARREGDARCSAAARSTIDARGRHDARQRRGARWWRSGAA